MDDTPDAAARARRVAMSARDEVAVEVHDGLACRLAAIHPHVVTVRLVALLDPGFRQVQNGRQRLVLFRRRAQAVKFACCTLDQFLAELNQDQ